MTQAFEHVLAVRGRGGYRQYRIPALVVTARGTVLAAYDGRPNLDDLPNPIDLLIRRSTDSGRSWSPQQLVRSGTGLEGFGDPSLLVDRQTGRIFLFHAAGTKAGFFEAVEGLEPDDAVAHCDYSFSDDDGMSWRHRRITGQLKRAGITGIFAVSGQGVQLHAGPYTGRLVQPFVVLHEGEIKAAAAYSDDHGQNWTLGEFVGPGTNENSMVCLADGRVLLHSRATPFRLAALSHDGGHSFGPLVADTGLPDPSCNGSVVRYDGLPTLTGLAAPETDDWILASNPQDPELRRNLVLSLSRDNGRSWPHRLTLCTGSSAYSTAARLPDGNIGVLYERQGYREIVFHSVDPQELAGARQPESGGGDLVFDMELRSITPGRPQIWRTVGESHELAPADGAWDVHSWKEVGQGYSADAVQILGTREAQELNYGPPVPGYKAGDIFAFTGRVRNASGVPAAKVRLSGTFDNTAEFAAADLAPGGSLLYFMPVYTVTESDAGRDRITLEFTVSAVVDSRTVSAGRVFGIDLRTGDISLVLPTGLEPVTSRV